MERVAEKQKQKQNQLWELRSSFFWQFLWEFSCT